MRQDPVNISCLRKKVNTGSRLQQRDRSGTPLVMGGKISDESEGVVGDS